MFKVTKSCAEYVSNGPSAALTLLNYIELSWGRLMGSCPGDTYEKLRKLGYRVLEVLNDYYILCLAKPQQSMLAVQKWSQSLKYRQCL